MWGQFTSCSWGNLNRQRRDRSILPAFSLAEKIMVYCNGAECDESLQAAVYLRDTAGLSNEKLSVYPEGFTGWAGKALPVEPGLCKSGDLGGTKK
jgi:rhodanese-related sulfurtransferase